MAASDVSPVAAPIWAAAAGAGDVDAAMDGMDPGRARIGHDDAGRAEDRKAPDNAEAPVGGALGDLRPAGNRNLDVEVDADAEPLRHLVEIGADHGARGRIDRRLARRQRQSRPRHRPDALAGAEAQARAFRREPNRGHDQRAMRDVGIVAGVLDDAGAGDIGVRLPAELLGREREFGPQPLRQRDRDGIGKGAGQQRLEGRARRAARAGAGRPPAPQRLVRLGLAHRRLSSSPLRPCLGRLGVRGERVDAPSGIFLENRHFLAKREVLWFTCRNAGEAGASGRRLQRLSERSQSTFSWAPLSQQKSAMLGQRPRRWLGSTGGMRRGWSPSVTPD